MQIIHTPHPADDAHGTKRVLEVLPGMHEPASTQLSLIRQLTFCAGHRLYRHESKCAFFHGHNYRVDIEVVAAGGDAVAALARGLHGGDHGLQSGGRGGAKVLWLPNALLDQQGHGLLVTQGREQGPAG